MLMVAPRPWRLLKQQIGKMQEEEEEEEGKALSHGQRPTQMNLSLPFVDVEYVCGIYLFII